MQTASGKEYEGIFQCVKEGEEASPVLHMAMATLTADPKDQEHRVGRPVPGLAFPWSQVTRLSASNVGISDSHVSAPAQRVEGIGTDADISKGRGG